MAIVVAGPRDPGVPGSLVEDALAEGLLRWAPHEERVWEGLGVVLGTAGLRHLGPDEAGTTPARSAPAGNSLGPAGRVLVERVRTGQVAQRRAYAEEMVAIAELADLVESSRLLDGGGAGRVTPGEYVAQVVAFELGISTRAAMERLGRAWALQRLPRVLAALRGGWLGVGAANAMVAATGGVRPELVAEVERRVLDALGAGRLPAGEDPLGSWTDSALVSLGDELPRVAQDLDSVSTPGWVRARCRTAIKAVDPEALSRQVKAARCRRGVRVWDADQPGLAWLALLGTQAEVAACYRRIDAEATDRHRAMRAEDLVDPATGELPTLANSRADVMVDQLLGPRSDGSPGPPVNLTVHLLAATPDVGPDASGDPHLGPGSGPRLDGGAWPDGDVRIDQVGPVVREALDDLVHMAKHSASYPRGSKTRPVRVRTVPPTRCPGHAAGDAPGPYRLGPDLAAQVVARDVTCRFPGCTVPAAGCDLDHTVPWPAGPTCCCNLAALCRRHHRVKTHHPGWLLTNHGPSGRLTWAAPSGRTIDCHPGRGSPGGPAP